MLQSKARLNSPLRLHLKVENRASFSLGVLRMQEIEVQFTLPIRGVQLLDPRQATSLIESSDDGAGRRESLRPGGPSAQLDVLRSELDELRSQLEKRRQAPDPAATAAVLQRENELKVEIERTRATRQALESLMKNLGQLVTQLKQEPERLKIELQEAAIHLGELIASKLLHETISSEQFDVKLLVQEIVQRLDTQDVVTVALNPADRVLLKAQIGDGQLAASPDLIFEDDPSLDRGNVRASTSEMTVSHNLREQMNQMMQQLREASCWDSI